MCASPRTCPVASRSPFTREQEAAEIATLTVDEIVLAEADLRGVTAGLGRLQVSSSSSSSQVQSQSAASPFAHDSDNNTSSSLTTVRIPTRSDLLAMEAALDKIPLSQKSAYLQACLRCPAADETAPGSGDLYSLSTEFKAHFLERENCHPTRAAQRYVSYWTTRLDTFGSDLAYRPMTLSGALRDEVGDMVRHSVFQILPHTDKSGRAIIWFHLGNRRFDLLSEERESRILFYLYHTLCGDTSDAEIRRAGFVLLGTSANVDRTKTSFRQQQFLGQLADVMPIHMRSGHICHPSPTFYYVIYPVLRMFMGRKWRLRTRLHYGDAEAILRELDTYGLPRARVPTEIGGTFVLNLPRWVGEQSMKEKHMEARYAEKRLEREEEERVRKNRKPGDGQDDRAARSFVAGGSTAMSSKRQRKTDSDEEESKESAEDARSRIIGNFNEQLLSIGGGIGGENVTGRKTKGTNETETSLSTMLEADMPDEDALAVMAKVCAGRENSSNQGDPSHGNPGQVDDDALSNLVDSLDKEDLELLLNDSV